MQNSVPSEVYNDQYYLGHGGCEGVEVFLATKGQQLSNRLATVLKEITDYKNKNILELGCGRGELALHLEKQAQSMTCIDYSMSACRIASTILKTAKVYCGDAVIFLPSLTKELFDIVLMNDFLEHLYDWQLTIVFREIERLTLKDSIVYINTPIIPQVIPSLMHVNIKPSVEGITVFLPNFELTKNIVTDPVGSDHLLIFKRK